MGHKFDHFYREHPILTCLLIALCFPIVALIGLTLMVTLFIIRCNIEYDYVFLYPAEEIVSIELIQVEKDYFLYSHHTDHIPGLLDGDCAVYATLPPSEFAPFLEDFARVSCHEWFNDPNPHICGQTVRITYADGSREWICRSGTFFSDVTKPDNSMTWYYFDYEEFDSFLQPYGSPGADPK